MIHRGRVILDFRCRNRSKCDFIVKLWWVLLHGRPFLDGDALAHGSSEINCLAKAASGGSLFGGTRRDQNREAALERPFDRRPCRRPETEPVWYLLILLRRTMQSSDGNEQRLLLYHQHQVASLMRKDGSARKLSEALALTGENRLPRPAVEFRVEDEFLSGVRPPVEGLGTAIDTYLMKLHELDRIRFRISATVGLTLEHVDAFDEVVAAAETLDRLGWPVNWQQNVQAILELSEIGLRDGKLVDRFCDNPETVSLGDELQLLGTVTFYRQIRSETGVNKSFKAMVLSAQNKHFYESKLLRIRKECDDLPSRFRYSSEWMAGSKESFRIAI